MGLANFILECEKDNEQLRNDINYYKNFNKRLQKENKELKKQLEEKQNPLKGIFAQVNDDTLLRDCGNMNAEINELKNQQKEFIEYLESEIKYLKIVPLGCKTGYLDGKEHSYIEILSKYKEIIGGKDDNK